MTDLYLYFCGNCGSLHTTTRKPPKYPCPVCGEKHWHSFVPEDDLNGEMQESESNNKVGFFTG